ncbi:hypothetical protein K9M48_05085 [Candidatus Gracilibacteria bacterium]|nr:hypothetical protein [Candidatus Gracilibacteria bacterium]
MSLFAIGIHKKVSQGVDSWNENGSGGYINILKKLKDYSSLSIISILEFSSIREMSLKKYMDDTNDLLKDTDFVINDLQQKINILKSDMQDCMDDKNVYDKQYFQALELYDQSYMDESLEKSIYYQKCASENRINMNANIILLDMINHYYTFIKTKYDYIESKQDLILRNFDFMKTDILDELLETKAVLKTLNSLD